MPYTRKVKRTRDASDKSAATTSSTPLCHLCQSAEPEPVRDSTSYHKSCTPIKNLPKAMSACTTATAITASTNTSSVCSSNMQMPMPMMVQELCPVTGVYANITDDYYISPTIIGKGHYGIVRECIHIATNQSFAVKSIDKSKVGRLDHLQREIFLLANVGHDNIMKLVDCYEDASFLHIITEKYTGGELYDAIIDNTNSHGCLSEQKAGAVIKSMLEAVAYLHDNGVVHRDIKPENILFESKAEDSDVKLIDFGLSRRHQKGESPMTNPVGTAYYMSPELLAKQYDSATDLWSIGVVAYVLLCGFPPFNGRSDGEIMESTRRNRLHFRGSGWMDKSDDAMDFVRCLLRKDPRKRFTAREALMHPWISNM